MPDQPNNAPDRTSEPLPLTTAQRKMRAHHLLHPGDPAFNGPLAFEITGPVDAERLRAATERVVRASRGLNTVFPAEGSGLPAAVVGGADYRVELVRLDGGPEADRRTVAEAVGALADTPMRPDQWPLFAARIWQSGAPAPDAGADGDRYPGPADPPGSTHDTGPADHPGSRHDADPADHPGSSRHTDPADPPPAAPGRPHDSPRTYLAFVFSHLVCDATGLWTLFDLIALAYRDPAAFEARAAELLLVPGEPAGDPHPEDAVRFFREQLAGVTALDSGAALTAVRGPDGALPGRIGVAACEPALAERIRRLVAEREVSPFAFHLAAYAVVVSRLVGREEIVLGIPLANRLTRQSRKVVGHFVNTLPIRLDLAAYDTFEQLCRAVQLLTLRLLRHQDFDLTAHGREVFGADRPVLTAVDSAFTYYRRPLAFALEGCEVRRLDVPRAFVKYPLAMAVENGADDLTLIADLTPQVEAARPLECYRYVLEQAAERFDRELAGLALLDGPHAAELEALAGEFRPVAAPASLSAWFDGAAAAHPDRIAVEDQDAKITYAELAELTDRAAAALAAETSSRYVAVSGPRRIDLVIAILAVLKSGKGYVPLDPAAPPERLARIVGQFEELPLLAAGPTRLTGVSRTIELRRLLEAPGGAPLPEVAAGDVAYVIFTSGTTGAPKGVEITHGSVTRLFAGAGALYGFGAEDTWCLLHSPAFDMSVWEIFGPLLHGARLVVPDEVVTRSPADLADLVRARGVTVLTTTPTAFAQLLTAFTERPGPELRVRLLCLGGEALRFSSLRGWFALRGEDAWVDNQYGPTETTMWVTRHRITPADLDGERASVIGRPMPDVRVRVVDRHGHRVPAGAPGELLVGGPAVARGYLNAPVPTAERFTADPVTGERFYRTGDRVVLRPDGTLSYLGRADGQVQLRGYRVELGEVEQALHTHAAVREAVVRVDDPDGGRPRLVAYLVTEGEVRDAEVREHLRARLPGYMIPSFFVTLPALPLNVNGKVDAAALPAPGGAAGPRGEDGVRPDSTEGRVREIWRAAIGTEYIGPDDNFFDVGGTSMHVTEVHALLRNEFGVPGLAMVDLFAHTTVRSLAAYLDARTGSGSGPEPAPAPAADSGEVRVRRTAARRRRP